VLMPRADQAVPNRYSWPSVSAMSLEDLLAQDSDHKASRRGAWSHTRDLALIARAKFSAFKWAMFWFRIAVIGSAGWFIATL
jgi:hypothetical protein